MCKRIGLWFLCLLSGSFPSVELACPTWSFSFYFILLAYLFLLTYQLLLLLILLNFATLLKWLNEWANEWILVTRVKVNHWTVTYTCRDKENQFLPRCNPGDIKHFRTDLIFRSSWSTYNRLHSFLRAFIWIQLGGFGECGFILFSLFWGDLLFYLFFFFVYWERT